MQSRFGNWDGSRLRILLLEDDPGLGRSVQEHLTLSGYQVAWARSVNDAAERLVGGNPDLLLFDLRLPDGSGLDLLRTLRARGDRRPVIILTARDQITDRIAGLNAGADDYLVKPFELAELVARIRAVARRSFGEQALVCDGGAISLDFAARVAHCHGEAVALTAREWALLEVLARRPGTVLAREQIEEAIGHLSLDSGGNALEVYISRIRRKLGHTVIETLRGVGYRLLS
jgi:two-component system OmpR family response regulator